MPQRDPSTGKFVASDSERFGDIEVVTWKTAVGVPAADNTGAASFSGGDDSTFEGVQVVDYDEIVDRNETLVLLSANHRMTVYSNSTSTADGTVRGMAEVSASPARAVAGALGAPRDVENVTDSLGGNVDDSIDLLGRPMLAVGTSPFSDGTTGVGGGGATGIDEVDLDREDLPADLAEFHPRDELFVNGAWDIWNIADAGVHMDLTGQHVYGVLSD